MTTLVALAIAAASCSETPRLTRRGALLEVSLVDLGRGVDRENAIVEKTDTFAPTDTVHASVITNGAAAQAQLRARWLDGGGRVIGDFTQRIVPRGTTVTEFHVHRPDGLPEGRYEVQIYLNGTHATTEPFEVRAADAPRA